MHKRQWQSIYIYYNILPTIKEASWKKFNQVLTVTDRSFKQVILIRCLWKDTAPQVAKQFLHEVVRHPGLHSSIASDSGTKCTSVF